MRSKTTILFLLIFCLALASCGGKQTAMMQGATIEIKSSDAKDLAVSLVDRKIEGWGLDVRQPGKAIIILWVLDTIQIKNKTHEIRWKMEITLPENEYFKISK